MPDSWHSSLKHRKEVRTGSTPQVWRGQARYSHSIKLATAIQCRHPRNWIQRPLWLPWRRTNPWKPHRRTGAWLFRKHLRFSWRQTSSAVQRCYAASEGRNDRGVLNAELVRPLIPGWEGTNKKRLLWAIEGRSGDAWHPNFELLSDWRSNRDVSKESFKGQSFVGAELIVESIILNELTYED